MEMIRCIKYRKINTSPLDRGGCENLYQYAKDRLSDLLQEASTQKYRGKFEYYPECFKWG